MIETATMEMARSMVSKNDYQGDWPRVLCVCSAGLLRSPTLAYVLSNAPYNCNTRAAGSHPEYGLVVADQVLMNWAQHVVFVNAENFDRVNMRKLETGATVWVLDIPDNYGYREPGLIAAIESELQRVGFPRAA
jgi:predicted protein tyrosine phosphatase